LTAQLVETLELFDNALELKVKAKKTALKASREGTFTDNMKLPVHRWFRYSAGFSAEWVEKVIDTYNPTSILDPFVGSGTTVIASKGKGVTSYGYESHPFVARVARAKTFSQVDTNQLKVAEVEILAQASRSMDEALLDASNAPDLLTKCYSQEALLELNSLKHAYLSIHSRFDFEIAELVWLAITSILRKCSHVGTAQWQYVLPNKSKSKVSSPLAAFQDKISEICADLALLQANELEAEGVIFSHDCRLVCSDVPANSVDLVITSPPYPNNYDYADATRLEMTFWGEVTGWGGLQKAVRQYIIRSSSQHATAEKLILENLLAQPEIEAIREELTTVCNELAEVRLTKGGKKAYHTMVAAYFVDLAKVFISLRASCRVGSTICFVIGDSAPYGVYVPVDQWLGRLAQAAGFGEYSFEKIRDRNTKWKNRKHTVPLHEGRLWIKG
jgi:hypothetical protein